MLHVVSDCKLHIRYIIVLIIGADLLFRVNIDLSNYKA